MIEIIDAEHFKKTIQFARSHPNVQTRKSFRRAIGLLNRIKRNSGELLTIAPDWVEHSWRFRFTTNDHHGDTLLRGQITLHGGVILHGYEETLSVTLEDITQPEWRVHT